MTTSSKTPSSTWLLTPNLISWISSVLAALGFTLYYVGHTVVLNIADPRLVSQFQGDKPYQLRVFMPLLLLVLEKLGLNMEQGCQLLTLGSVLVLAGAFRLYLGEFLPNTVARFACLAMWPPLILFYSHHWFYLYDIPSLIFLCFGLFLLNRKKWIPFALVLAVACLNRESSVLLVLAYAATYWESRSTAFWWRLIGFTLIWATIKAVLTVIFASNPGSNFERHWDANWVVLQNPDWWPPLLIASYLLYFALFFTALYFWRNLPRLLRVTTFLGTFMLLVFFFVGVLQETRLLGETVPLLLPPVLIGIWKTRQSAVGI